MRIKWFPFRGISLKLFLFLTLLMVSVFAVIIFININYHTNQIESNIRDHAVQASNLIKRSIHNSMLKNHQEDLAITIANIGREQYIENIRIFKKIGQIAYSTDTTEVNKAYEKTDALCIICHIGNEPRGIIPHENKFRELASRERGKTLGLLTPIENEPSCFQAPCHAHRPDETLLGYLDMTISLHDLEASSSRTRNITLILSLTLIVLATIISGRIIHYQVNRPISKLIDGTKQLANLNLDYTLDLHSDDEIGNLAKSFNTMTQRLKESNEKLKDWSQTLEDRVSQKTEALEKAQQQLIQSEKRVSIGRLAGVVAHELNNPMSSILTYSKLLIRELSNKPDQNNLDEAIENLMIIRDESKRCGDIVNNLLMFSKQPVHEKSKQNLELIIDKSLTLIRHSLEINNIRLIKHFGDTDTVAYCDPAAVEQMIIALVINAVEAASVNNGEIIVSLDRDEIKNALILKISDNGLGIPEAVLPHIFDPYFTTKNTDKNTGLGLSIVYGIVESHHGSIEVQSGGNMNTQFTVTLPIENEKRIIDEQQ